MCVYTGAAAGGAASAAPPPIAAVRHTPLTIRHQIPTQCVTHRDVCLFAHAFLYDTLYAYGVQRARSGACMHTPLRVRYGMCIPCVSYRERQITGIHAERYAPARARPW